MDFNTVFELNECRLRNYAKKMKLNKWLALATHPLVFQYVQDEKPEDLSLIEPSSDW
uniref:Uncharacterized protein n=1 Tax=Pithovirus LCPAC401 TaxID=2506595 RepID=A0A481ZBB0_9VIRU|nr:MAG: hypothetical protein LCPAC401_00070 [Pithovirus LCPAC401]